ncbi:hypothetical protein MNBD_PLANCTO02-989 [hydrothermal vent metagenome]|uniref:Carbohydrate-binding domain-containing protein n=1 Tax=hydrothermal vent metagenome TaxID=652676 RepID=A0A3B1DQH6_9ZZZZ
MPVVPHQFLFRYSFPVIYNAKLPRRGKQVLGFSSELALPHLGELDEQPAFAEVKIGWNEKGVGIAVNVLGKKHPPQCDISSPDQTDCLQVWIDTRNTQSIHRASQYCHHFSLFPNRGGKEKASPVVLQRPIIHAREEAPLADVKKIKQSVTISTKGYLLETWFPATTLHGFDFEATSKIGFYYSLHDTELGNQFLTVNRDFPFTHDPSLWSTLDLLPEK